MSSCCGSSKGGGASGVESSLAPRGGRFLPGRMSKTDMSDKTFSRRVVDGITMFVVTALSLLLLVYVGFGEGHRSFEQFHIDKVTAQGRIVQNTIESYLRAG